MKHTESKVKVYETSDYSLFSKIIGNRDLNPTKIKKILADIEAGTDILKDCPILVMEVFDKLEIFDGQHRFNISRLLKRPVHYIIIGDFSLDQIAKVNSNQEKWKQKDFINCYCENNNKDYIELKKFMDTFKFSLGVSLQMLCGIKSVSDYGGNNILKDFESGKLIITQKENAWKLAKIINQFNYFKGYKSRLFITALTKIIERNKIDIDELVQMCNKNKNKLEIQPSWKLYIQNLETICNIGKHNRVIIY